ncbi:SRPBCC family protein [Streptomyces sp. NPDC058045]|uniref:SRPBCC family protein n=1 Tax=Streptomyces sp. NPDC058045 TaxID=3346311 RepID=UPI0036E1CBB1
MAIFRLRRDVAVPVAEAWRRMTDWPRHGTAVPLTRVTVGTPPPTAPGTRVTARTGVGRLGFADPMEVTVWEPPEPDRPDRPARCRLEKRGAFVLGWAEIAVTAHGTGARVEWHEELRARGLPRWADPLLAASGRLVFGRAARILLRAGG